MSAATGDPPRFPGDLAIVSGMGRPPRLYDLAQPDRKDLPAISIAHTEGIAVALAARNPDTPVGIDIEPVREDAEGTDALALTDEERLELPIGAETAPGEWIARFRVARQAAAKASGLGPPADPAVAKVVKTDAETGDVSVALRGARGSAPADLARATIRVRTAKRGNHIWAWTLGEEVVQP